VNIPGWANLTEVERRVIEWQFRLCGDFRSALWNAIKYADDGNLERLRIGFPDEVEGFLCYQRVPGWWRDVCQRAGGDVELGG